MELVIKAAVAGVAASVFGQIIKKSNPEITLLLSLSAAIIILASAFRLLGAVMEFLENTVASAGLSTDIFSVAVKCTGIALASQLASEICRDCGQGSAASAIETAGSIAALYTALPLAERLMRLVEVFL